MLQKGTMRVEGGFMEAPGHFDKSSFGGNEGLTGGGLRMNPRRGVGILQQTGAK